MNTVPTSRDGYPMGPPQPESGQPLPQQVRRSRKDRVLAGVCGGLGRYLNVDPVVLRIATVALIFAGVGIPAYLIAWIAVPETDDAEPEVTAAPATRSRAALVLGIALAALGGLLLIGNVLPWFDSAIFWPLVVVGAGVLLVVAARR